MDKNQLVVSEKLGQTRLQRVRDAAFVGAVTASTALIPSVSNAAELDLTAVTGELAGVKTAYLAIIAVLVVLIGIGIGWVWFKKSAK